MRLIAARALLGLIYLMTVRELTARNDLILREQANHFLAVPESRLAAQIALEIQGDQMGLDYVALISPGGELLAGNIRVQQTPLHRHPYEMERGAGHGPLKSAVLDGNFSQKR